MGELTELARFDAHLFLAAMTHAGDGDVRYYLNGVKLEAPSSGGLLLVGCNGHRMLAIHDQKGSLASPHPIIVPRVALPGVSLRGKRGARTIVLMADSDRKWPRMTLQVRDEYDEWIYSVPVTAIEGRYPEWRNVVPLRSEIADQMPAAYNIGYIADLDVVPRAFGVTDWPTIYARGKNSAIVIWEKCRAVAILMPVRVDTKPDAPDWLTQPQIECKPTTAASDSSPQG
jgi:hypothetical protein